MGQICLLCDKEFARFLEHISIAHNITSVEEYELKVMEKEDKKIKIQKLIEYIKELTQRLRKGEISPEKLRELRAKWERDNNLIW